jgi:hypothetical protein
MASASTSPPPSAEERAQLRDKYGDTARHMYLSKEQVDGMVDEALHKSETVKFMLDSLKKVPPLAAKLRNAAVVRLLSVVCCNRTGVVLGGVSSPWRSVRLRLVADSLKMMGCALELELAHPSAQM